MLKRGITKVLRISRKENIGELTYALKKLLRIVRNLILSYQQNIPNIRMKRL
jgi:hypothetical protein